MIIKDGTGTGQTLKINSDNQALVSAATQPYDQYINTAFAKTFSLPFEGIDPVGADDYFFYIKNTGTKNFKVSDIRIRSSVIGIVEVHHVTGTASFTAGTDVTPVNRTVGSAETLTATIKTDTDTTGLTNAGTLFYIPCSTADEEFHLRTTSNIIIPPGQSIALLWDTATGVLAGVISVIEVP